MARKLILSPLFELNPALTIFVSTILAYSIAIIYETSYLSAFGIGSDVVQVTPVVMFYSIIIVGSAFAVLEIYSQTDYLIGKHLSIAKKKKEFLKRYILTTIEWIVYVFVLLLAQFAMMGLLVGGNKISGESVFFQLAFYGLVVAIAILGPFMIGMRQLITHRSIHAVLAYYYEITDKNTNPKKKSKGSTLNLTSTRTYAVLYILIVGVMVTVVFASNSAHAERTYYVVSTKEKIKRLVIKHYGGNVIMKDYDTARHEFKEGYAISAVNSDTTYSEKYLVSSW